jgi:aminoglycoside phosphotransferase (APT) family kinase protein
MMNAGEARKRLAAVLERAVGEAVAVTAVRALSGGAASLTYAVDAERAGVPWPLVLQVSASDDESARTLSRPRQAALQQRAGAAGVRVAPIVAVLTPQDGIGEGFVMEFVPGETLAPKWLRDDAFAHARTAMVADSAEALARIHAMSAGTVADLGLPAMTSRDELAYLRELYDRFGGGVPVFELAFGVLDERLAGDAALTLVHGDFRSGNFIVDDKGLAAVLDWELAHVGDRYLDIGWLCTNTWRFGHYRLPVGGFGTREAFYDAYAAAGGAVIDRARAAAFEMLGSLRWGVMCMQMTAAHLAGEVPSVERAAIGRRVSETEADLLYMLKYGAL